MTSLKLNYVALTDVGLRRSTNQDSGYASDHLLVIADGMGGAAAGDLASAETMNIIRHVDRDLDDVDPLDALEQAVAASNRRLGELVAEDPAVEGMGTTLEAMLWDGQRFATAHIGDSRAYRLRDGRLEQISADHTFVQSLVDEGKLTPEEARVHPHRSLLLRVMLGRDDNDADLAWVDGQLGDRYLLCSDGLSDMVDDAVIEEVLGLETVDIAATELVRRALDAGGYDNVTVVIGELVDADAEPDEDLSSSDGRPQLVGAAADGPRPRTDRHSSGPQQGGGAPEDVATPEQLAELDPEELRYAPQPPSRWRWAKRVIALVVIVAVLAAGALLGYRWSQDQYFVAEQDGKVTIFRGVQADLPLVTLQHVESVSDVQLDDLTQFEARQVREGIAASSLDEAREVVEGLAEQAEANQPTPSPSPKKSKKTAKKSTSKKSAQKKSAGSR